MASAPELPKDSKQGIWEWTRQTLGRRPITLVLLALGVVFLLLGLTTGIDLPFLKHVAVDQSSRWFARILGLMLLAAGIALLIRTGEPAADGGSSGTAMETGSPASSRFVQTVGVEQIYLGLKESWDPIIEAMTGAQERIQLVGISHRSNLGGDRFEETIRGFLIRPNSTVDVFFLDPESKAIDQRAQAEETDPQTFREEVLAGVRRTAEWRKAHPTKVRLFFYDAYPVWRLERIDNDLIFAHSYPPGARGTMGAVMHLRRVPNNGSMFAAFDAILDRLESGSKPVPEAPAP
jgi:hypothetical protein